MCKSAFVSLTKIVSPQGSTNTSVKSLKLFPDLELTKSPKDFLTKCTVRDSSQISPNYVHILRKINKHTVDISAKMTL